MPDATDQHKRTMKLSRRLMTVIACLIVAVPVVYFGVKPLNQRDVNEPLNQRDVNENPGGGPQEPEDAALSWVKKRGGTLRRDQTLPDKPIVEIDLSDPFRQSGQPSVTDKDLADLPGSATLRVLKLQGTGVTDAGLKVLAGLKNLRSLDLAFTKVSDEGLKVLPVLPLLETLGLVGTAVTANGLKNLAGMKNLHTLGLHLDKEAALFALADVNLVHTLPLATDAGGGRPRGPARVQTIDLRGLSPRKEHVQALSGLPNLRTLILSEDSSGLSRTFEAPEGVAFLKALPRLESLRTLRLSRTEVADELLLALAEVKRLQLLEGATDASGGRPVRPEDVHSLDLSDTRVTSSGLKGLTTLPGLQKLKLPGSIFARSVATIAVLPNVRFLDISGAGLKPQALQQLAGMKQLRGLVLGSSQGGPIRTDSPGVSVRGFAITTRSANLTDAGMEVLAGSRSLESLHLVGAKLTDKGMKHIAGLTTLKTLDLSHVAVSDRGLKELSALPHLEGLRLNLVPLTAEGLKTLASLKRLRVLSLSMSISSDEGVKHLAALENLEELDLSLTGITDASLKDLASLRKIQKLDLRETRVTAAGIEQFQGAVPDCKVIR
jgi:Leucine-rich repeat (LRR) protein